eukprot:9471047-Pyramimonas_sp.AAC.1
MSEALADICFLEQVQCIAAKARVAWMARRGELSDDQRRRMASTSAASCRCPDNKQRQQQLASIGEVGVGDETGQPSPSDSADGDRAQTKAYWKAATDLFVERHVDALPMLQVVTVKLQKLLERHIDMSGVIWESRQSEFEPFGVALRRSSTLLDRLLGSAR